MPTFVQLVTFQTDTTFDMRKDSKTMNEVLTKLQANGAKIMNISSSIAGKTGGSAFGLGSAIALYVITYEANKEITV